jgi:hypothetical protein
LGVRTRLQPFPTRRRRETGEPTHLYPHYYKTCSITPSHYHQHSDIGSHSGLLSLPDADIPFSLSW